MKKCPQCAEMVQTDAKVCRYCSRPFSAAETLSAQRTATIDRVAKGVGAVIVAGMLLWFCSSIPDTSQEQPARAEQALAAAQGTARIERLVRERLRDPASATFQHIGGGCGYVNSRNGFGGMGGNKPFIVGANNRVVFREDGSKNFDTVWRGHCLKFSASR